MHRILAFVFVPLELLLYYAGAIALSYEGSCYGFSDGASPCSLYEYVGDELGWMYALWTILLPEALVSGAVLFVVNLVVLEAVAWTLRQRAARPI